MKYHGEFFPLINLAGKVVRNLTQYPCPYESNGLSVLLPYLSTKVHSSLIVSLYGLFLKRLGFPYPSILCIGMWGNEVCCNLVFQLTVIMLVGDLNSKNIMPFFLLFCRSPFKPNTKRVFIRSTILFLALVQPFILIILLIFPLMSACKLLAKMKHKYFI